MTKERKFADSKSLRAPADQFLMDDNASTKTAAVPQQQMDTPAELSREVRPASPAPAMEYPVVERRTRRYNMLFLPSLFEAVEEEARLLGISVSEYIHIAVADKVRKSQSKRDRHQDHPAQQD